MSKASKQLSYHQIFIDAHPELGLKEVPEGWVIHHKDGNHSNNDPDNLQLMTRADHCSLHQKGKPKTLSKEHLEAFAKAGERTRYQKGHVQSEEWRRQHSERMKGREPGNKMKLTDDMKQDLEAGISRRAFQRKYGVIGPWRTYRK